MKPFNTMKGKLLATGGALVLTCVSSGAFAASYNDTYYPQTDLSYNNMAPSGYAPYNSNVRYNDNYNDNYVSNADSIVDDSIDIQQQGNATFVTGGIGEGERNTFKRIRSDYNLHLMNAGRDGGFTGDTNVRITDRSGNEVISATAGPLFYAQLPKGTYNIEVTNQGVTQRKTVTVSSPNSKDISFIWNEYAHVN